MVATVREVVGIVAALALLVCSVRVRTYPSLCWLFRLESTSCANDRA